MSKSPSKPEKLLKLLSELGLNNLKQLSFPPFTPDDFHLAHSREYVRDFFAGKKPLCTSNSIPWSTEFAESVTYTNASLYYAQKHAMLNPETICFSPTSGFHHAIPARGSAFCTFSGQVISALKIYQEFQAPGLWIDMDAHYGNSIEESREFCPKLNQAIPRGCNVNPVGMHSDYLNDLAWKLKEQEKNILDGSLKWIAFAQGADSHEADDLSGQLSAGEWLSASTAVYKWIAKLETKLERPIPLTISLFGGYRSDDYDTVLHLHAANIITAMRELVDHRWQFDFKIA